MEKLQPKFETVKERMELNASYPPNWGAIHNAVPEADPKTSAFTFGSQIFVPEQQTDTIGATVLIHEVKHSLQQNEHPAMWWEHWIKNPHFRKEQEAEAYAEQYEFFCRNKKDRNTRAKFLHHLCANMSGKMYGNMCSYQEAKQLITHGRK